MLIFFGLFALATAGAVGAGVSAYAGGSSAPSAPPKLAVARPLHARLSAAARPFVAATNVSCGESVTASVTLNGDLQCSGNGLLITKASVTLNLNGHTIQGGGGNNSAGVRLEANSDIVENGVITGFHIGVDIVPAGDGTPAPVSDTVTKIRATYNQFGMQDVGSKSKITANITYANSVDGIYETGTGATISGNRVTSNGMYGILVSDSQGALVTGNEADSNGINGIWTADSRATTLTSNIANFNVDDGMVSSDHDTIDGGGNLARGNDTATGVTAEQCSAIACS